MRTNKYDVMELRTSSVKMFAWSIANIFLSSKNSFFILLMSSGADLKSESSLKPAGKPLVYDGLMERDSIETRSTIFTVMFVSWWSYIKCMSSIFIGHMLCWFSTSDTADSLICFRKAVSFTASVVT